MQNASNNYLKELQRNGVRVATFLNNGLKLEGIISEFDDVAIIYTNDQLIMRNSVATVQPAR